MKIKQHLRQRPAARGISYIEIREVLLSIHKEHPGIEFIHCG